MSTPAGPALAVPVAATYPADGLYVAKAPDDPTLTAFADLGVRFVDPGGSGTPAGRAGPVRPWVFASMDHLAHAAYMTEPAARPEAARKVT